MIMRMFYGNIIFSFVFEYVFIIHKFVTKNTFICLNSDLNNLKYTYVIASLYIARK